MWRSAAMATAVTVWCGNMLMLPPVMSSSWQLMMMKSTAWIMGSTTRQRRKISSSVMPLSKQQQQGSCRKQSRITPTTSNRPFFPSSHFSTTSLSTMSSSSSSSSSASSSFPTAPSLSNKDEEYMRLALCYAKKGLGRTFPNPAVGCVLVANNRLDDNNDSDHDASTNDDVIIGAGFHPQAGFPHAEVFALLQAYGHVESGVKAAESVVSMASSSSSHNPTTVSLFQTVQQLTQQYTSPNGPAQLFGSSSASSTLIPPLLWLDDDDKNLTVTAYVTLEPCCHFGRTPPCAMALITTTKVQRVVVGLRDPNPKVQGGGIQLLRDAGIAVQVVPEDSSLHSECYDLVASFVQRITRSTTVVAQQQQQPIKGAQRATLRSLAHGKKTDGSLALLSWPASKNSSSAKKKGEQVDDDDDNDPSTSTSTSTTANANAKDDWQTAIDAMPLDASWLDSLDQLLLQQELVLLRLKTAVAKRKMAERLGQRIADAVQAHVIQSVGHTVLLYRPIAAAAASTRTTTNVDDSKAAATVATPVVDAPPVE